MIIHMTLEQVVGYFNYKYEQHRLDGDSKNDFYCGITHDLKERNDGHEIDDCEIVCHVRTSSFDDAKAVEAALNHEGYNTGGKLGNGIPETTIVYMYRRTPTSKP